MSKYIMKFSKQGDMKYISHLDTQRLIRRSFKRIGMDLVYSNGFNPHPKMSIALPLSLGYESKCELMDFETKCDFDPNDILNKLSQCMPRGINLLCCERSSENETKTLASKVTACEYEIIVPNTKSYNIEVLNDKIVSFLAKKEIIVLKKQKKSKELKSVDIKSKIKRLDAKDAGDNLILSTVLDAGSESNLNPELMLGAFWEHLGMAFIPENVEISRIRIYLQ